MNLIDFLAEQDYILYIFPVLPQQIIDWQY